jgi:5-methylthioadenosine/S-adenosylhomocysteine deaminase
MNEKMDRFSNGFILIKDSKIIDLGTMKKLKTQDYKNLEAKETINAKNHIVFPGMINAHGHFAMTLFRGLADDLPLKKWLEEYIWPIEANLSPDDCFIGTQLAAIEMIQGGTTAACDMYFNENRTLDALEEIGFRGILGYGLLDFNNEEKRAGEFETAKNLLNYIDKNGKLCTPIISPHAPYTCSPELLIQAKEMAKKNNLPLQIHLAETEKEVKDFESTHKKSPTQYLYDIDFLNEKLVAAHCVWLNQNDMKLLKEKEVKIAHNPSSNMKLGSGVLKYQQLVDNNITIALGTDGASSNNNLSMFGELRLASLLHKGVNTNPQILPASEALQLATINGAKALSQAQNIGSLEIGKKADIAILDFNAPNTWPPHNPYSLIAYAATDYNVKTTIINGEIVMKDRQLLTIDVTNVLTQAKESLEQILDKAKLPQYIDKKTFLELD